MTGSRSRAALSLMGAATLLAVLLALVGEAAAHSGGPLTPPAEELDFWQVALEFGPYGAKHILLGYDHLLFLAGLALLSAGVRDVLAIVALFALSYSATLIGGTLLGIVVPGELVDAVIAVSVAYVGVQIAFGAAGRLPSRDPRGPALVFGLAHGLGLSSLLQELQLPGDDVLPSVIGFNVGVELGQIAVIATAVALLSAVRAFPIPARQRIPVGFAFVFAGAVFLSSAAFGAPAAFAHPAAPPPPPATPPRVVDPIPPDDEDQYVSRVTSIKPPVPGLEVRILGGQEKIEFTWTGKHWLVVEGVEGEPMVRMSARGIEINERSSTAFLSADRYAEVAVPGTVDPSAQPRWRRIESPGPISWYEHRAQWMTAERPEVVGDGDRGTTVFHWRIPARLGDRQLVIRGSLDWLPDPDAIRAERSEVSSPLASAGILAATMALGALVGVFVRRRVESEPAPE